MLVFAVLSLCFLGVILAVASPLQDSGFSSSSHAGGFVTEIRRSFRKGSPVGSKTGLIGIFDPTYAVRL